jgi:hypothetical protein
VSFPTLHISRVRIVVERLCGDSDLDLDTGLDVDDDLLDDLGRSVEIDETCPVVLTSARNVPDTITRGLPDEPTLVDPHLVGVPCLGTLSARSLARGDLQALGGQADGTLDCMIASACVQDALRRDFVYGPRSSLPLDLSISSWQTFSSDFTLREVRVMRILWILGPSPKSFSGLL